LLPARQRTFHGQLDQVVCILRVARQGAGKSPQPRQQGPDLLAELGGAVVHTRPRQMTNPNDDFFPISGTGCRVIA
jgi:hypothetical protein